MTAPRLDFRALQAGRGYVIFYRQCEPNHCPGCGGSAWHVGRQSAECARCGTAIPHFSPGIPIVNQEG
ncbi:hypothetical protein [Sphingobium aromaticiconvertens]|uniref:hypothetical protein n=1 Tax=Sphingobium aromaticiconvertens TaxID=365341 RepID=UPI00301B680C